MRAARSVGADRALHWYREAMRLWKRGPGMFAVLALAVLAGEIAFALIPVVGSLIAQLVLPLVACGLLYASLAADRGDRPRLAHLAAVFGAPPQAIAAIVAAGLVVFAAEAIVAWRARRREPARPARARRVARAVHHARDLRRRHRGVAAADARSLRRAVRRRRRRGGLRGELAGLRAQPRAVRSTVRSRSRCWCSAGRRTASASSSRCRGGRRRRTRRGRTCSRWMRRAAPAST